MLAGRPWLSYPTNYREREMRILADWIRAGISGTVVGPSGIGKTYLLGYLCHRPDVLQQYLPPDSRAIPVSIDLNNMPADDTSTLFRVILRSIYESRDQFNADLQQLIATNYLENREATDPFITQSALRELLLKFQELNMLVVLVMDRFDRFCQNVDRAMVDAFGGLRASFTASICYIVGMRQEVSYLPDPTILGELYELLDNYVCWVQPMESADAQELIEYEMSHVEEKPTAADLSRILKLGGGHPGLLRAICHWWRKTSLRPETEWVESIIKTSQIQYRLNKIWQSLTLAEQHVLGDIQKWEMRTAATSNQRRKSLVLDEQQQLAADVLAKKGLITDTLNGWEIGASLISAYASREAGLSPGSIWLEESTNSLYQGSTAISDLTPLENSLLYFLVLNPKVRHTHTDLIFSVWPADITKEGVSTEALYQVVRGLRTKIEPNPSQPQYLVSWRGSPEGGYIFFPEGNPG